MNKYILSVIIGFGFAVSGMAQKTNTAATKPSSDAVSAKPAILKPAFTVKLKTSSYKSGVAFLCFHMGKNLNIEDSATVNENGVAEFTADS
jgi:N-acetylmuramoyl-L-alanine amidase CwlA